MTLESSTPLTGLGRIPLDGTYNLRDTGGYATPAGLTRRGRLYRSDALHNLTPLSRQVLGDLGVRVIVDLRTDDELRTAPSSLDGLGLVVHHAPVFEGGHTAVSLKDVSLGDLYESMIDGLGVNLTRAVALVANAGDAPVLVHCTAGKDRTGIVVALILLAVGVDRADVVADYASTEQNLRGEWTERMLDAMTAAGYELDDAAVQLVSGSPAHLIERVIDRVEAGWGSAADYLLAHGLSATELADLRSTIIEPSDKEHTA